ncbi:hypothetical protein Tco_1279204, partial [Tanacetum coccineum]
MISRGQFVAHLLEHFRLLTEERLQGLTVIVPDLPVIDMAELVRLPICEEVDDTWTWVASGPERQQVVAAGAPEVPQPPPIAGPARTMAQRLGRLEKDIHGLREALGEQREDLTGKEIDKVGEVLIIWNPICIVVML